MGTDFWRPGRISSASYPSSPIRSYLAVTQHPSLDPPTLTFSRLSFFLFFISSLPSSSAFASSIPKVIFPDIHFFVPLAWHYLHVFFGPLVGDVSFLNGFLRFPRQLVDKTPEDITNMSRLYDYRQAEDNTHTQLIRVLGSR